VTPTSAVDDFLADGCGRCDLFKTDRCKVRTWSAEIAAVRAVLHELDLVEEIKWGQPCYTVDGKNVVLLSAMREACTLSFLRGALLSDPHGLLEAPGPNSQAARFLRFRSLAEVEKRSETVREYVNEAIRRTRAGEVVAFRQENEPIPEELQAVLDARPDVAEAWEKLTRGRRRSHGLHVAGAKQSATRERRAGKCAEKILAGKGFQER